MQINDFKTGLKLDQQPFLIKSSQVKVTKKQSQYIKLLLSDQSGQLNTNLWDATPQQIEKLTAGQIVVITGKISSYHDNLQIDIQNIALTDQYQISQLMPSAPEDYQQLKAELMQFYYQIKNPVWQLIVKTLLQKHEKAFLTWPAAVNVHHNFYHGLLFHTLSILRQLKHFSQQYPQLNAELMYAGAIIHDMGKTVELSGNLNTEYTTAGKLLGHISIIDGEINRIAQANNIPEDNQDLILLRHMVLSHHGKQEYGSPVEPQLLEAIVLHMADETDAQINTITKALHKTKPGEWTAKLWTQNNHQFLNYQEGDSHQVDWTISTKQTANRQKRIQKQ